jgi:hypothetical protein
MSELSTKAKSKELGKATDQHSHSVKDGERMDVFFSAVVRCEPGRHGQGQRKWIKPFFANVEYD